MKIMVNRLVEARCDPGVTIAGLSETHLESARSWRAEGCGSFNPDRKDPISRQNTLGHDLLESEGAYLGCAPSLVFTISRGARCAVVKAPMSCGAVLVEHKKSSPRNRFHATAGPDHKNWEIQ
jgi:hypothetical protein